MTSEEFDKLQKEIATAERELARNEGMLSTHMKALKDTFGVSSIKEANALLIKEEMTKASNQKEADALYAQITSMLVEST